MENFTYSIPTTIHFGKRQIEKLGAEVAKKCTKVLVVFGGGSVKRNGVYDDAIAQLDSCGIAHIDFSGVEPNPKIGTVREGVRVCKENGVDGILALGGGSIIDCSKTIAAGALYDGDAWDFLTHKAEPIKALPIYAVVTIAATGSEMDGTAVISNPDTNEKLDFDAYCVIPTCAICDPTYTFSLPAKQTAAGVADIMSHTMENYFAPTEDAYISNRVAEAILKTCVECGPRALEKPNDYAARANLMWASSWAINGFVGMGKPVAWSVHRIEHELSAFYNITHGVGIALLTPHWMRYVLNEKTAHQFAQYGINVFGVDASLPEMEAAKQAIDRTEALFVSMGLPMHLSELNIGDENFEKMAEKAWRPAYETSAFAPLTVEDICNIYKMAL